jgi:hypothetical protein
MGIGLLGHDRRDVAESIAAVLFSCPFDCKEKATGRCDAPSGFGKTMKG